MHRSQRNHMALSIERYLRHDRHYRVLDVGSRNSNDSEFTHRALLEGRDVDYTGIDLQAGPNVDRVMPRPYRFPVPSRSVDVVISGSVFEHVPYPWATILEIARVLTPGGLVFLTAPSRGHRHNVYDCWRYYPDGFRALACWAHLDVVETFFDRAPLVPGGNRYDYAAIDSSGSYWGDTSAVLRKPERGYPEWRVRALRAAVGTVANRTRSLPPMRQVVDDEREQAHRW